MFHPSVEKELRKGAKLRMTYGAIHNFLNLNDDVRIVRMAEDCDRDIINIMLVPNGEITKSRMFDLAEGQRTPDVNYEEVAPKPKLYSHVIKHGLTYEEAQSALKQGCYITRSIWGGYWRYQRVEGIDIPIIVAYKKNGERVPAQPYQEDLLAEDWMIVKVEKEELKQPKTNNVINVFDKETYNYLNSECKNPYPRKLLLAIADLQKSVSILMRTPIALECAIEEVFGKQGVIGENKDIFHKALQPLLWLLSRNLVRIIPFADGQIECVALTDKGIEMVMVIVNKLKQEVTE